MHAESTPGLSAPGPENPPSRTALMDFRAEIRISFRFRTAPRPVRVSVGGTEIPHDQKSDMLASMYDMVYKR